MPYQIIRIKHRDNNKLDWVVKKENVVVFQGEYEDCLKYIKIKEGSL